MLHFIARRLALGVLCVLGVTLIVTCMLHFAGDPVKLMLDTGASGPDIVEQIRHELGLDKPLYAQYLDFLLRLVHGDLGTSLRFRRPAFAMVVSRLPATAYLSTVAMVFALVVAVPVGITSATRPGTVADVFGRTITLMGQSVPLFWLGIMLVLLFSVTLRWFPAAGWRYPTSVVLPAVTLGLYPMARITRTLRTSLLEVLSLDYIVAARSKGLTESAIMWRHALPNAATPVLTIASLQFGAVLGASIVTETIFAWPGVGSLLVQSIATRDLPLVRAIVVINALIFIVLNLLTDIIGAYLSPRVRLA
jgi:ABC-type dipeptide/oligopeptide/nickel transport system permease component